MRSRERNRSETDTKDGVKTKLQMSTTVHEKTQRSRIYVTIRSHTTMIVEIAFFKRNPNSSAVRSYTFTHAQTHTDARSARAHEHRHTYNTHTRCTRTQRTQYTVYTHNRESPLYVVVSGGGGCNAMRAAAAAATGWTGRVVATTESERRTEEGARDRAIGCRTVEWWVVGAGRPGLAPLRRMRPTSPSDHARQTVTANEAPPRRRRTNKGALTRRRIHSDSWE